MNAEEAPILGEIHALTDQLKVVVDAIDELSLILDHLSRNRDDTRYAVYNVVEKPQLCLETVSESCSCADCDATADSLAEALQKGWTRLQADLNGLSWNYLGECESCTAERNAPATVPATEPKTKDKLF